MMTSIQRYQKFRILGFDIVRFGEDQILEEITNAIKSKISLSIGCLNTYYYNIASRELEIEQILNSLDILHSDGIGMYFASRLLYGKGGLSKRLTGTDLYFNILKKGEKDKWKIFLLGNSTKIVERAKTNISREYPNLNIVGCYHGYFDIDDDYPLKLINESDADIVFIGLGIPKQELWLKKHSDFIKTPVRILSGSGIAYMARELRRGPRIFRSFGFEWIYRLVQEPKRLWRRYLLGNPQFFIRVLRARFNHALL